MMLPHHETSSQTAGQKSPGDRETVSLPCRVIFGNSIFLWGTPSVACRSSLYLPEKEIGG